MNWVSELQTSGLKISFRIKKVLYRKRSRYQLIEVFDTYEFGRMMMLDRKVMLTQRDEFIYHEMIVHPPVALLGGIKNVLVIGGGDGGTVRELLKYSPERITLVEIDRFVVEASKKFFPEMGKVLDNPVVDIVFEDGAEFVKKIEDRYDLVIVDSTDPVGPGEVLFSEEFISDIFRITDVVAGQTESPFLHREMIAQYHKGLKKFFKNIVFYTANIPTYPSGIWSFTIGVNFEPVIKVKRSFQYYTPEVFECAKKLPPAFRIDA